MGDSVSKEPSGNLSTEVTIACHLYLYMPVLYTYEEDAASEVKPSMYADRS